MKSHVFFPETEPLDSSGVVSWTPDIYPDQVVEAYEKGIFPWPEKEKSILWFSPLSRGILEFDNVKWSKSDLKFFKKTDLKFYVNRDFEACIKLCAKIKELQEQGTWITKDMIRVYTELNRRGKTKSFEVYSADRLVGGVYGVLTSHYFSAESMFYIEKNASKYALFKAIEHLKKLDLSWLDTQMLTDFTQKIGARMVSRKLFLQRIFADK